MAKRTDFNPNNAPPKPVTDAEKKWLDEEIEVEFQNIEEPGLMLKFAYGTTKNPKTYTLMHGGSYKLPRHVVRHLESRQTPIWAYQPDGTGMMAKKLVGSRPRFNCRQTYAA